MKKVIVAALVVVGIIAGAFGLSKLYKKEFAILVDEDLEE